MQRKFVFRLALALSAFMLTGCHKKRILSNFHFHAGQTQEEIEDEMGSPDKSGGHWISYTLNDGNELRIGFLAGERGGTRTLSSADLFIGSGPNKQDENIFKLPAATQPATAPTAGTQPTQ